MISNHIAGVTLFFCCFSSLSTAAVTVFDNRVGGTAGIVDAHVSDNSVRLDWGGAEAADDFRIGTDTTIHGISWTALLLDHPKQSSDNVTVKFFADIDGSPANEAMASFYVGADVERELSPRSLYGFEIYDYATQISGFNVDANQVYWISIQNDLFGFEHPHFWGFADSSDGNGIRRRQGTAGHWEIVWLPYSSSNVEFDFRLTTVPEPSSLLASSICFIGSMRIQFRRKRKQPRK